MKKKSNRLFLASSIVSLACYGSYYLPLGFLPFLSLFSIAIPLVLTGNLLLLFTALLARKKWWLFPAINLLLGTNFILESYAFNTTSQSHDFSLLGYNVKSFREHKRYDKFSGELINWSVNESSDIKCFQEYSTNPRWSALDITSKMINNGYHAHVFKAKMEGDHAPGMAIFSKFPIIHRGLVWESIGRPNACIYSDVLIDKDTVRIYNIHLESMQLELYRLRNIKNLFSASINILSRIIHGTKKHSQQIEQTIQHCLSSPYPFVLAGDFNELPYSNNYRQLDSNFRSSFHHAGSGFDFTLNNLLFFLRIDHQFFGEGLEAVDYDVNRKARISDHFPTRALYHFK